MWKQTHKALGSSYLNKMMALSCALQVALHKMSHTNCQQLTALQSIPYIMDQNVILFPQALPRTQLTTTMKRSETAYRTAPFFDPYSKAEKESTPSLGDSRSRNLQTSEV